MIEAATIVGGAHPQADAEIGLAADQTAVDSRAAAISLPLPTREVVEGHKVAATLKGRTAATTVVATEADVVRIRVTEAAASVPDLDDCSNNN